MLDKHRKDSGNAMARSGERWKNQDRKNKPHRRNKCSMRLIPADSRSLKAMVYGTRKAG